MSNLRLSEAIRLGSMLKPQGFGLMRNRQTASCALDAAQDATGMRFLDGVYPFLTKSGRCPECGQWYATGLVVIAYCLNDIHRWSREKIADWVEATFEQEAKQEEKELEEVAV